MTGQQHPRLTFVATLVATLAACGVASNGAPVEKHPCDPTGHPACTRYIRANGQRVEAGYETFVAEQPAAFRCATRWTNTAAGWYVDEPTATPGCHQPEGWALTFGEIPPTP
jgi:hypothetical protein